MEAIICENNSVLDFTIFVKTENGFTDVTSGKFMESLKIESCYLTSYFGCNGRAGITYEIFYIEYFDA